MTSGDAATRGPAHDRAVALCCALLFAGTFGWFWPTLHHGLRSDDFLGVYYTDRLTGAVRWGRVFEEFVRSWFGNGELYRPLISLSYGVELALFPSPAGRHACSVFFVAVAATATGATAALLAPRCRALAACLAGGLVVLHPASVETASWISARVTSLEMAFGALACFAYARHLVRGRPLWPCLLLQAAALASKEGAATLPVTLLALHCLHAPDATWRTRARAMVPFAIVFVVYLGWRLLIVGRLGPVESGGFALANARNVAVRAAQLFAPPDAGGAHAFWAIALLLLALAPAWRRFGARALLLPLGLFLVLAPTWHLPAHFAELYGRFVFDGVVALALVLGVTAATAVGSATLASGAASAAWLASGAAAIAWLAVLALTSLGWMQHFANDDRLARGTERALVAAAANATPAQPFACSGLPYLPLFHQKLWGVLGLSPFAPRDLAVIALPELLVPDEKAPEFRYDAAPVHAVLAAGGTVATLRQDTMQFAPLPRPAAGTTTLAATAATPRDFVAPSAWPGSSVAALEVHVPTAARELRWRLLDDVPTEHAFGTATRAATSPVTWIDTTHVLAPVLLQSVGAPFRGVHLEVDGGDPPAGTTITVHATLPVRALPAHAAGAERTREQIHALTEEPPFVGRARFYLVLPTGVRHQDVPPGGAAMSAPLRENLRWSLDIFAPLTVHWFWQSVPDDDAPPWRSELDWATAR